MLRKCIFAVAAILLFALNLSAQRCEHTVQRGEDFSSIAQKYGITVDELKASNPSSSVCYVGRKLLIPNPGEVVKRKPVKVEPFDYGLISSLGDSVLTKSSVTSYQVGEALWKKKKYKEAMAYLSSSAYSGDARAYYPLGDCYSQPSSGSHDVEAATDCYMKALEKVKDKRSDGYRLSCLRLSEGYAKGEGLPKDIGQARRLFDEYRKYSGPSMSAEATALQRTIVKEETAIANAEAAKRRAEQQARQQELQRRGEEQQQKLKEQCQKAQQAAQVQRQHRQTTVASAKSVARTPSAPVVSTASRQRTSSGSKVTNPVVKTWREELGSNFVIVQKYANGIIFRTRYRPCPNCLGSQRCGGCHGTTLCGICKGQGGIVTSGYGQYIPCYLCNRTGRCNLCQGTGRCMCTNPKYSQYPGYVVASTSTVTPDGTAIRNTAGYNGHDGNFTITPPGGNPSTTDDSSSGSSRSSSSRSSGTCSKCHGRRYETTSHQYAAASTHGWHQPYHNSLGSKCPYCTSVSDHYHYACSNCRGTGRNQ